MINNKDIQHLRPTVNDGAIDGPRSMSMAFSLDDNLAGGATDLLYLAQLCIKWLFTTKGSDVFNPDIGGNWRKILGTVSTGPGDDGVRVNLVLGVRAVDSQIKAYQSIDPSIPNTARLRSLEIPRATPIVYDSQNDIWLVPLSVKAYSGDATSLFLPMSKNGLIQNLTVAGIGE